MLPHGAPQIEIRPEQLLFSNRDEIGNDKRPCRHFTPESSGQLENYLTGGVVSGLPVARPEPPMSTLALWRKLTLKMRVH